MQKVAVVTGSMGGLGKAICHKLSKAGYLVIVTYSPENDNAQLWLASQKDDGFNFYACMIDVAEYASCEYGIKKILDDDGHMDVLTNNVGITRDATLKTMMPKK